MHQGNPPTRHLRMRRPELEAKLAALSRSLTIFEFAQDGTILNANPNFLQAVGHNLDEIRGQHHALFVDPEQARRWDDVRFWQRLNKGQFQTAEFRCLGKGGREVFIQATYNPIRDMSGRPFKVVKYATDITENMRARTQAIASAEQTLMNVQTLAAAAEEINASVREITGAMGRSKEAVDLIHGHTITADRSTAQLRPAAEAMDGVVQLITKTAEQINLLSLNATIESMRAGEAGKGFAVMASEVKTLANQTTAATGRISEQIGAMQAVSTEVVETLAAISTQIGSVQGFVTGAASAIEQQSAVTQEISATMQTAALGVENITRSLAAWR